MEIKVEYNHYEQGVINTYYGTEIATAQTPTEAIRLATACIKDMEARDCIGDAAFIVFPELELCLVRRSGSFRYKIFPTMIETEDLATDAEKFVIQWIEERFEAGGHWLRP